MVNSYGTMSKQTTNSAAAVSGIIGDFENLFKQFEALKSVRYTHFLQVWKQMQMSFIFAGRQTDRECREFTEECLKLALTYCLDHQLQVKIFGLYLMYGLYFKYPFFPKVKIRVTLTDWNELMNLLGEIRKQEHLDAEFIFLKLRYDRAFQFVATKSECVPAMRGTSAEASNDNQQHKLEMLIQQKSIISELFESDTIDQLAAIHEEYHRVKCALAGPNVSQPDPSINVIENGLIHMLTKSVTTHEDWRKTRVGRKLTHRRRRDSGGHTTSESEVDSEADSESASRTAKSHGAIRAEIKARAFSSRGNMGSSRRYRKPVLDVDNGSSPSKVGKKKTRAAGTDYPQELTLEFTGTVGEKTEGDESAPFVFSMPCLVTEDDENRKGKWARSKKKSKKFVMDGQKKKKKLHNCIVKKRGRPKKIRIDGDTLAADANHDVTDSVAQKIKKSGRPKTVKTDFVPDASGDIIIEPAMKKRRRSKKVKDTAAFDLIAGDVQELDITFDEQGSVIVHVSTEQQLNSPSSVTGKKRGRPKKDKALNSSIVESDHVVLDSAVNKIDEQGSVSTEQQLPSSFTVKKRGRPKKDKTLNSSIVESDHEVLDSAVDIFDEQGSLIGHVSTEQQLTSPSSVTGKKRGRPKKDEKTLNNSIVESDHEVTDRPTDVKASKRKRHNAEAVTPGDGTTSKTVMETGTAGTIEGVNQSNKVSAVSVDVLEELLQQVDDKHLSATDKPSANESTSTVLSDLEVNAKKNKQSVASESVNLPSETKIKTKKVKEQPANSRNTKQKKIKFEPIVIAPDCDDVDVGRDPELNNSPAKKRKRL